MQHTEGTPKESVDLNAIIFRRIGSDEVAEIERKWRNTEFTLLDLGGRRLVTPRSIRTSVIEKKVDLAYRIVAWCARHIERSASARNAWMRIARD